MTLPGLQSRGVLLLPSIPVFLRRGGAGLPDGFWRRTILVRLADSGEK